MVPKLRFPTNFTFCSFLTFFTLFFCSIDVNAQCDAGNDAILPDVCNNVTRSDLNAPPIKLADALGPHTEGGTWSDDNFSGGLNVLNGNLRVQDIRQIGIYHYTYSLNNINGCTDSATVTITIGGYTGIPQAANACSNNTQFSLFQAFNGAYVLPLQGGIWSDDTPSGGVDIYNGILNATIPPTGINYSYTYTIDAIGTCSKASSPIQVFIVPYPKTGKPTESNVFCSNNLTGDTNFNLNNLLENEDQGGKWSELSGTSEVAFPNDNIVNVQNIYNTKGAGNYNFKYTIPKPDMCLQEASITVSIKIEELPDVSNLVVAINPVCQGKPATVQLNGLGALTSIAITYNINSGAAQTIPLTAVAGAVSFVIPATKIPNVGVTTFTITNVTNVLTGCSIPTVIPKNFTVIPIPAVPIANDQSFCKSDNATVANLQPQGSQYQWFDSVSTVPLNNTKPLDTGNYSVKEVNALTGCESSLKTIKVVINPTPQINDAIAKIDPICQGSDAIVNFTAGTTNLTNGDYNILYELSGSNVTTTPISAILKVTGGMPTFTIDFSRIPKAGNTTVTITNIKYTSTTCSNTSTFSKPFVVNAAPDVSNMSISVNNGCLGQDLNVDITGLTNLTNITLSYAVTGINPITSQTIPLVVSGGKTSFLIPRSSLSTLGSNTLIITEISNAGNSCPTVINSNSGSKIFSINTIPNSPTAGNQEFCETDLKTVSDLVPSGSQYKWYDSPTSATALASDKLLVTGNYHVKEMNGTTACESIATPISVLINTVQIAVLEPNGEQLCGIDKPTIQNLLNNTTASANFAWYDAITNGSIIPNTDLLSEGATYYGFDYNTTTECYSRPLPITVSLTDCIATNDNFFIPDGFSPNGDGVNETFRIIDIEFLFPNYTLEIFNRYGNVLFKGDIKKPDWDGKNSNSSFIDGEAPTGVYFYIINYNKDNWPPRQGQLYLNR